MLQAGENPARGARGTAMNVLKIGVDDRDVFEEKRRKAGGVMGASIGSAIGILRAIISAF